MQIAIPISTDQTSEITTGTYDFTFKNTGNASSALNALGLPLDFNIPIIGKHITISSAKNSSDNSEFTVRIVLNENPIALEYIVIGLTGLAALTAGYLILTRVEKIVDSPLVDVGIILVAFALVLWPLKRLKG